MGFHVWKKIFAHILRHYGYLEDYDTICVLVDARNLAEHQGLETAIPRLGAVALTVVVAGRPIPAGGCTQRLPA